MKTWHSHVAIFRSFLKPRRRCSVIWPLIASSAWSLVTQERGVSAPAAQEFFRLPGVPPWHTFAPFCCLRVLKSHPHFLHRFHFHQANAHTSLQAEPSLLRPRWFPCCCPPVHWVRRLALLCVLLSSPLNTRTCYTLLFTYLLPGL